MTITTDIGWHKLLLTWYRANCRTLSWRSDPTPYRVWISEIMLQQTQVETVKPYYERFMQQFPDVAALAAAPESQLLKAWEGLGYYTRAKNLHRTAKTVAFERDGVFPKTFEGWLELTGIGAYTAAAVSSIAFGVPVPVVDGNVLRVYARLFRMGDDIKSTQARQKVFSALTPVIQDSGAPSDFNQAMMELGALICRPKSPQCGICPLQQVCQAYKHESTDSYPVTSKRPPLPHRFALVMIVVHDGMICLQRRDERLWHGLFTFPQLETDHAVTECSTVLEHLSAAGFESASLPWRIDTVRHVFTHFSLDMIPWICPVKQNINKEWINPLTVTLPLPVPVRKILNAYNNEPAPFLF